VDNAMPFFNIADITPFEILPGARIRAPFGKHLMLSYLEMDEGAVVPFHRHPHEQGGIVMKGKVELTIEKEVKITEEGSMYIIPPNCLHRAVALGGPAIVLDVFSPVREDYAERFNKYIDLPETTGS
jgi:quercetin dioxygenase-like cupin family protein